MTGSNRLPMLAEEIKAEHLAALAAGETATRHAIQAGRLLIEAKSKVKHGGWLTWLKDNCCLSERTAQRYMRLAAKVPELDLEDATRVSDLPIREALKVIADEGVGVTPPPPGSDWDTAWAWAEKQVKAPFNRFDFDNPGGPHIRNKLCAQVGVPAPMSLLLGMINDEVPALRLASNEHIFDSLRLLAPLVKDLDDCYALDFDQSSLGPKGLAFVAQLVRLEAEIICGRLFQEMDYRAKHWDLTTPEGNRKAIEEWDTTCDELINWCARKAAELEVEDAAPQAEARP